MRCRDSSRSRSFPSSWVGLLSRHLATAAVPSIIGAIPAYQPVKLPEHDRVVVQPELEGFQWEFIWSHCLCVRHVTPGCGYFVISSLGPEGVSDRPLGKPCDAVEFEIVKFLVERRKRTAPTFREVALGVAASFLLHHGCTST